MRAGAFPIGIDVEEFTALTQASESREMFARMKREYSLRNLMVGVDRLDYSKGLPQRMRAFRELLQKHPETHRRATLIQIASPSREDVSAYTDILHELESLCGSINGNYGDLEWMPVRYIHRTVARTRLPGLYRASRVALVTPLRDGMNLVAKEAPLVNERDGVLILSENVGAYEEIGAFAIGVNPFDIEAQAEALHTALTMPRAERRGRAEAIRQVGMENDIAKWLTTQLNDIEEARGESVLPPGADAP